MQSLQYGWLIAINIVGPNILVTFVHIAMCVLSVFWQLLVNEQHHHLAIASNIQHGVKNSTKTTWIQKLLLNIGQQFWTHYHQSLRYCSPFNAFTAQGVVSPFFCISSPLYTTPNAPEPSSSNKMMFSYGISSQRISDGLKESLTYENFSPLTCFSS